VWRLAEIMRTVKKLYPLLCDFSHLLRAYHKAFAGTKNTEAYRFCFHLETELLALQQELADMSYQPKPYRYFEIYDPKQRTISVAAFRDRVVHHAIVALLEPIYEAIYMHHSYATRKGKGTYSAIKAAQKMLRRNYWYLKADVRKYFESINPDVLMQCLQKKVKDANFMTITERIVRNAPATSGLPIGNLTSQFFANVYLHELDMYVLHQLKPEGYIRYMDDFVLFSNDKQLLQAALLEIRAYLDTTLQLQLKEKAVQINHAAHGLSFLGTRIFRGTIRVRQQNLRLSLRRLRLKHHLYKRGKLEESRFLCSANSIMAHLGKTDSLRLRQQLHFLYRDAPPYTKRKPHSE